MTAGDDQKKEAKGFAGLESMVSDVDTTAISTPSARRGREEVTPGNESPRPTATTAPRNQPSVGANSGSPPEAPREFPTAGKWLIGVGVVVGLIWLGSGSDKPSTPAPAYSPSPAPMSAATQTAPPNAPTAVPRAQSSGRSGTFDPSTAVPVRPQQPSSGSFDPSTAVPVQPQRPVRPTEERPPIGTNLAFNTAQIRYCVAEKIRVEAAREITDNYSETEIGRFNAMVNDFNSRCGEFRYRRGTLESARADVEAHRSAIVQEGRARIRGGSSSNQVDQPVKQAVQPRAYTPVANVQQGSGTSLPTQMTAEERSSMELACILEKGKGPSSYNACLKSQAESLASGPRRPDLSRLSSEERSSIELACILDKGNGPATYNACLHSQLGSLASGPRRPDLSGLSSEERSSIDLACILEKGHGPASHNACLRSQLASLNSGPRRPDMSRLTSRERSSVEMACILEKGQGPATYNQCLIYQMAGARR